MAPASSIVVEFYGMARRRAGRSDVRLRANTLAEALAAVAGECSQLTELLDGGRLSSHYLVSVNAGPFLASLDVALDPGDRVLLLSADAGG